MAVLSDSFRQKLTLTLSIVPPVGCPFRCLAATEPHPPGGSLWSRQCRLWAVTRRHFTQNRHHDRFLHIVLNRRVGPDDQPISEWDRVSREGVHMRDRALLRSLMLVMVMMLFVTACSSDEPAAGPVSFRVTIDFADGNNVGTFVVLTGADVLGCSSGTAVRLDDADRRLDGSDVMTCTSGSNAGTFKIARGMDTGRWNVLEGSDDFAGLQGEGTWTFRLTSSTAAVETYTGDIEYSR